MSFWRDILGGGGDLHNKIMPRELRGLAPKELQPGGFDPARDWFGFDIKANPERDAMMARQKEAEAAQQAFMQGGSQIPVGMAPPQQQIPIPAPQSGPYGRQAVGLLGGTPPASGTAPTPGSYGGQAQQLAGLLGGQQHPVMQPPFTPGPYMPGWRPGDPLATVYGFGHNRQLGQVRER